MDNGVLYVFCYVVTGAAVLYDNIVRIDIEIGGYDMLDGFRKLETKLVMLYRLLKENGMTNE